MKLISISILTMPPKSSRCVNWTHITHHSCAAHTHRRMSDLAVWKTCIEHDPNSVDGKSCWCEFIYTRRSLCDDWVGETKRKGKAIRRCILYGRESPSKVLNLWMGRKFTANVSYEIFARAFRILFLCMRCQKLDANLSFQRSSTIEIQYTWIQFSAQNLHSTDYQFVLVTQMNRCVQ